VSDGPTVAESYADDFTVLESDPDIQSLDWKMPESVTKIVD
jgi:hypothetical protein